MALLLPQTSERAKARTHWAIEPDARIIHSTFAAKTIQTNALEKECSANGHADMRSCGHLMDWRAGTRRVSGRSARLAPDLSVCPSAEEELQAVEGAQGRRKIERRVAILQRGKMRADAAVA